LRALLRRGRRAYDALLRRFDDLEQRILAALAERQSLESPPHREPASVELTELATANAALQTELSQALRQFAERECDVTEARAKVNSLKRQLAESQELSAQLEGERAEWQQQIADLESRLTEPVARMQELESEPAQLQPPQRGASLSEPPLEASTQPEWRDVGERSLALKASGATDAEPVDEESDRPWDAFPAEPPPSQTYDWDSHRSQHGPAAEAKDGGTPQESFDWSSMKFHTPSAAEAGAEVEECGDLSVGEESSSRDANWWDQAPATTDDRWSEQEAFDKSRSDAPPEQRTGLGQSRDGGMPSPLFADDPTDGVEDEDFSTHPVRHDVPSVDEAGEGVDESSAWRSTPGADAPEPGPAPSAAVPPAAESNRQGPPQPTSFIERYAHLLEEDEPAEGASASPPEPARAGGQPTLPRDEPAAGHADDESLEDYMAKLMQRMRGNSALSSPAGRSPRRDRAGSRPARLGVASGLQDRVRRARGRAAHRGARRRADRSDARARRRPAGRTPQAHAAPARVDHAPPPRGLLVPGDRAHPRLEHLGGGGAHPPSEEAAPCSTGGPR